MTFGELVDKVNKIYQGKDEYYRYMPVKVSRDGIECSAGDLEFRDGSIVISDGETHFATVEQQILGEMKILNELKAKELSLVDRLLKAMMEGSHAHV